MPRIKEDLTLLNLLESSDPSLVEASTKPQRKARAKAKKVELPAYIYPLDPKSHIVCGIDEAGRGPLMGNVVAACVVLDYQSPIEGLNDSKKLSEKKRDALAVQIKAQALAYGIAAATPQEIDSINILAASHLAMERAYQAMLKMAQSKGLFSACELALIDGNKLPKHLGIRAEAVVKGDARVAEIAAASILAKTTRDAELYALAQQYPEYLFEKHKGYPTAEHLKLIETLPILDCYRKSYEPVAKLIAVRNKSEP